MAKEYIEREAVLQEVESRIGWSMSYNAIYEAIQDAPAADVVEVVRCKDCKYYNEDSMSPHSGWCEHLERAEYNEHFCSYGERRTDDGNEENL